MMPYRIMRAVLPFALLAGCAAKDKDDRADAVAANASTSASSTIPLVILADGKEHRFVMEVAVTPQEQAKGLMFRKEVPADGGMVFPMRPPRTASFWMENTWIPLDMLFVRTDGTIAFIAADRQPYRREPVSAGIPVAGVVELRGGRAKELGIEEGDKVRWGDCGRQTATSFCP
jgi:uncharacterized membrane protein (UPF0127 family)